MENTDLITEACATVSDNPPNLKDAPQSRKKFVRPEITVPVDVLEATTFFQSIDSGVTN